MATSSPALVRQAQLFALRKRRRAHAMPFELQMKAAGLPTPETEVMFARDRKWAFDYAWRPWMIALEVEGGVFIQGRHTRGVGFTNDCEKYNHASVKGWLVLRVTPEMVDDGRAVDVLRLAFAAKGLEL
jgi:hypothetical protein